MNLRPPPGGTAVQILCICQISRNGNREVPSDRATPVHACMHRSVLYIYIYILNKKEIVPARLSMENVYNKMTIFSHSFLCKRTIRCIHRIIFYNVKKKHFIRKVMIFISNVTIFYDDDFINKVTIFINKVTSFINKGKIFLNKIVTFKTPY